MVGLKAGNNVDQEEVFEEDFIPDQEGSLNE